jgi:RNA polymerase sigma factor (TIGR02999 family)
VEHAGPDLTSLLARAGRGDEAAANEAMDVLYRELHRIAAARIRHEQAGHTLQATALVSEAYVRLLSGLGSVNDRKHFFAMASDTMRRVLVDHARKKQSDKRGAGALRVTLNDLPDFETHDFDILAVDQALTRLAATDPRAVRVVELKFFCGHTDREVADILDLSLATVRRDWEFARAWLKKQLGR